MAQYVYTMNRVCKVVPPKREILTNISLSFFPGAKIGVLGLNGSGKSSLLRIMAGVDKDFDGEARPMPDIKVGYLSQEPRLDPSKDVRGNVEEGLLEPLQALAKLEQVYADYAEPEADFDALARQQGQLEDIIHAWDAHNLDNQLEKAADVHAGEKDRFGRRMATFIQPNRLNTTTSSNDNLNLLHFILDSQ